MLTTAAGVFAATFVAVIALSLKASGIG